MCITLCFLNQSQDSHYKLILVMNRDEYLSRPTAEADWGEDGVLCGRDMEPGREGGTWLGVDKKGRVAFLTNIFSGFSQPSASTRMGRGHLITDFLQDDKTNATDYMMFLSSQADSHKPFNLIILERDSKGSYMPHFYCHDEAGESYVHPKENKTVQFIGVSNSPFEKPLNKVKRSGGHFLKIVQNLYKEHSKDRLINDLFEVMSCRDTEEKPDPQLISQRHPQSLVTEDNMRLFTSTFLFKVGSIGTKSQTVILVDCQGNLTFAERTRAYKGTDNFLEWKQTKKVCFKIK